MKSPTLLAAAIAAVGLGDLFSGATFARMRMNSDPFKRRSRGCGQPEWVWCKQCERTVHGRRGRKHRCVARFIPSPPNGYRWQSGKLVPRKTA